MQIVLFWFTVVGSAAGLGGKASAAVIVEDGRTDWRITSPSLESAGAKYAVSQLARYVEQMTGCKLPVGHVDKAGPAIVVGLRENLGADDRALLPDAATGYDGYCVAISPGRIVVAGDNGRGVIYGVYDLLERFGCRWFYPTEDAADPEVVPKRDILSIETTNWSVASPIKYRICNGSGWFFKIDPAEASKQLDWAMKNRYNTMGWQCEHETTPESQYQGLVSGGVIGELDNREMMLHGPAHSFNHFLRAEDHMAKHPEWFGMRNGKRVPQTFAGAQFCWSNSQARKVFADNVEKFIKACPRINILCIVSFDGGVACECEACKKAGASNALMTLMNEVIDRLAVSVPGVLVETVGGYNPMTEPPKGVEINPRQRIIWAHWGRYHGEGYDDEKYGRKDNLELWRKSARGGLTLCQYYTDNFAEPWILPPFTLAMVSDRAYFLRHNIDAMYMLMWPRGYWWNHSLNGYIGGRCFYDVSIDPFAEIADYAVHYFGEKAGPLLAAYYDEWARNVDLAYRVKGDSQDSHRAMLAKQRRDFIDPAVQAVKNDTVLAYRVAKVEKLHTLAEHLTEAHRQRDEIRRLRSVGDTKKAQELLDKSRVYVDGIMKMFYALADLNQGLIERAEVPTFIKWGVTGWLDEEGKAIAEAGWEAEMDAVEPAFRNPIYEGADPWVVQHGEHYYLCRTEGNRGISVFKSASLTEAGAKRIVWRAPKTGWNRAQVWAPELHRLQGRWYIYYAASDGDNANHRAGVLEAVTDDPQGEYVDKGILYTGDDLAGGTQNRWAIDATPVEIGGRLYVIWSGWPDTRDVQYLYIAGLANPWTVNTNRVKLCENDSYVWERVGENQADRGLNEAPQVIKHADRVFVTYSCSGSWEPTYKLGMLELKAGADPLDPSNWKKHDKPAFKGTDQVFGVGHACFTKSPDGSEDWIVYHSKISREHGWERAVFAQRFGWTADGLPAFGEPEPSSKTLRAPSGQSVNHPGKSFSDSFDAGNFDNWTYYGYNRFIAVEDGHLSLGGAPAWGLVNDYRAGEKVLLHGFVWSDVSASVRVHVVDGGRDAGMLFRVRRPAVGYDVQQGYFAGIIPVTKKVVLGKTDGAGWTLLALVDHPMVSGRWYALRVKAKGDVIQVYVDDELKIEVRDSQYSKGMVGLRVVDTHAWFDDFKVGP